MRGMGFVDTEEIRNIRLQFCDEMKTALSKIWTPFVVFISYDNNYYTSSAS